MTQRCFQHDYAQPGIYHLTLKVADALGQPFGQVVGDISVPNGMTGAPHVALSPIGKMVEQELLHSIPAYYPMIEVQDYVIMPEHIHFILEAHSAITTKAGKKATLGQVIAGFKKGCNRRYWELTGQQWQTGVMQQGKPDATNSTQHTAPAPSASVGAPASSVGAPASSVSVGAPAVSVGAPAPSASVGAPGVSVGAPAVSVGAPAAPVGAPAVSASVGAPAVSFGAPAVSVGAPGVSVGAPAPSVSVGAPAVSVGAPAVSFGAPAVSASVGAPAASVGAPAPSVLVGAPAPSVSVGAPAVYPQVSPSAPSAAPYKVPSAASSGRSPLFAAGFTDVMPLRAGQLAQQREYIRNNPRTRLLRNSHRAWLYTQRGGIATALTPQALHGYLSRECGSALTEEAGSEVYGQLLMAPDGTITCDTFGNRRLLTDRRCLPVVCHRKDTARFGIQKARCLEEAAQGAVLASARIARGEQEIMDEALNKGLAVVVVSDNGFADRYHPSASRMNLCAEGRLLMVTPWHYHYRHANTSIHVPRCKTINCLVQALCRKKDSWWQ